MTRAEELAEKVRGMGYGGERIWHKERLAALSELVRLAELGSAISEPGWISTPEKVLQLRADAEALAEERDRLQEALRGIRHRMVEMAPTGILIHELTVMIDAALSPPVEPKGEK